MPSRAIRRWRHQTVNVDQIVGGVPLTVASGKTNSTGGLQHQVHPDVDRARTRSRRGQISVIENATLNPVYGDILSPAATSPAKVKVHGSTSNFRVQSQGGKALVLGTVAPGNGHVKGTVTVFARAVGAKGAFKKVATDRLATSQGQLRDLGAARRGRLEHQGEVPGSEAGQSWPRHRERSRSRSRARPASSISLTSVKTRKGGFTLIGDGQSVRRVRSEGRAAQAQRDPRRAGPIHGVRDREPRRRQEQGHVQREGQARDSWVLQLEYVRPGEAPSFSGLRTVAIH